MAWIYLAESEDSPLPWQSGSDQLPTVKTSDTLLVSYCLECRKEVCQEVRSGTTCEHSRDRYSQVWLTSFMADSPARMSVRQDLERAWMESEPAYSVKQYDLFENVNLSSYSSKMCQESENMCLPFGKSLRRLATIAGMDSLVRQKSEQTISGIDGGYLPTPVANDDNKTPEAHLAMKARMKGGPRKKITSLQVWVKMWPTPRAVDYKASSTKVLKSAVKRQPHGRINLGELVNVQNSGDQLSPTWVEWLMGYPKEWTVLEDWAMQWFRSKQKKRLKY